MLQELIRNLSVALRLCFSESRLLEGSEKLNNIPLWSLCNYTIITPKKNPILIVEAPSYIAWSSRRGSYPEPDPAIAVFS